MKKLPGGWTFQSLGEVFEVIGGGTPSKKVAANYDGDIPWATIRDMQTDEISGTERSITERGLKNSSAKLIPTGEVVMASRVGLGRASILRQDTAINQDIRALIPKHPDQINRRFCLYWLQSMAEKIVAAGSGATVQGIKLPFIRSLPFPVVARDEQDFIVAILDQAFAALDRARAHAEANLGDAQALFDTTIHKLFRHRSAWTKQELGSSARFIDYRGKTPPKSDSGIRLITAKNVRMGFLKKEPAEFVPEEVYESWMTRGIPKFGDVLFTTEAPLANVTQLDTDDIVVLGQRLITMQTDANVVDPAFLKWSLLSPQMQSDIVEQATGATVLGIKASLLKKISLYIPADMSEQVRIVEACERAFSVRDKLQTHYQERLADIALLRQSLLQQAFSGQLTRWPSTNSGSQTPFAI